MRSPLLMSRENTALLVIDIQERLFPAIDQHQSLLARCIQLRSAAKILDIPALITEQYPKGLGKTLAPLCESPIPAISKMSFSAGGEPAVLEQLGKWGIDNVLLCGIETHVCIQQSALDLLNEGYRVYVAADAVGSRRPEDKLYALQRMTAAGIIVTTAESAIFEWTQVAGTPQFKTISNLVKLFNEQQSNPERGES